MVFEILFGLTGFLDTCVKITCTMTVVVIISLPVCLFGRHRSEKVFFSVGFWMVMSMICNTIMAFMRSHQRHLFAACRGKMNLIIRSRTPSYRTPSCWSIRPLSTETYWQGEIITPVFYCCVRREWSHMQSLFDRSTAMRWVDYVCVSWRCCVQSCRYVMRFPFEIATASRCEMDLITCVFLVSAMCHDIDHISSFLWLKKVLQFDSRIFTFFSSVLHATISWYQSGLDVACIGLFWCLFRQRWGLWTCAVETTIPGSNTTAAMHEKVDVTDWVIPADARCGQKVSCFHGESQDEECIDTNLINLACTVH